MFYTLVTAFASWSAQEVGFVRQVLPARIWAICSAVMPFTSFEIAFRLPWQPPVNSTLVTTPFSSLSKAICVEQVPDVVYVYLILLVFEFAAVLECIAHLVSELYVSVV